MFQELFLNLSNNLNNTSVVMIWLFQIMFCYFSILLSLKFFGKTGIYVYVAIAIILANIQVLKVVNFPFFPEPMALGTVLFISIFLCTDILNEYFDKKSATKCIYLGIAAYLSKYSFRMSVQRKIEINSTVPNAIGSGKKGKFTTFRT
jgi:hypothetical protein